MAGLGPEEQEGEDQVGRSVRHQKRAPGKHVDPALHRPTEVLDDLFVRSAEGSYSHFRAIWGGKDPTLSNQCLPRLRLSAIPTRASTKTITAKRD